MKLVSYAQNFEDVMLKRALKDVEKGFYVDVGANDPVKDSVTYAFYIAGWRGMNIEPSLRHWKKLEAFRGDVVNLCVAVGASNCEVTFNIVDDTGLNTIKDTIAEFHQGNNRMITQQKVQVRTLTSILADGDVGMIHRLKVDVEGYELEVFEGLDLTLYRPWIIVVEAMDPTSADLQVVTKDRWEQLILSRSYEIVYCDGLNKFYLAYEHRHLKEKFVYPPNWFDKFILARHHDLAGDWLYNAEAERDMLIKQIASIRNTVSWRITKPLRCLKALARKLYTRW